MVALRHLSRRLERPRVAGAGRVLRDDRARLPHSLGAMTRPPYLPGDRPIAADTARMIRVDQAGEYGATRIYRGQLAVIRHGRTAGAIREMAEQEERHLKQFNRLTIER